MSLVHEAKEKAREVAPVLECISQLDLQARELLLEKGEDSIISRGIFRKKPKNPHKVIIRKIEPPYSKAPITIQVFSSNFGPGQPDRVTKAFQKGGYPWNLARTMRELETFSEDTPIVIHIRNSAKTLSRSLYLSVEHTSITDSSTKPSITKELGELGLEDLQPWQELLQQVEVSFKRQPLGHGEIPQ